MTFIIIITIMYLLNSAYRYAFRNEIKHLTKRGADRHPIDLKASQRVRDFTLLGVEDANTQDTRIYRFTHTSGLRYYHLDSSHTTNTFGILVNHSPTANDGASCVLERMLQCGDKKYRVKDVVEEMKGRSFNKVNGIETT